MPLETFTTVEKLKKTFHNLEEIAFRILEILIMNNTLCKICQLTIKQIIYRMFPRGFIVRKGMSLIISI